MLTQEEIYADDGRFFPVRDRTIQTGNPLGIKDQCIPGESIIQVLRRLAREQGKAVVIKEVKPRRSKWAAIFLLLCIVAVFGIGVLVSVARP